MHSSRVTVSDEQGSGPRVSLGSRPPIGERKHSQTNARSSVIHTSLLFCLDDQSAPIEHSLVSFAVPSKEDQLAM
eukprot:373860-Amphidinium_carterae.1